jgi:RNA polymerase sigma factor (sigma-70 family)
LGLELQNETQLVSAVLAGDRSAFDVLIRRDKNLVYGMALSMIDLFDDAESAAQEAFVQAYLTMDRLEDPERFGAWVSGICRNTARMWLRRESRNTSLDRMVGAKNINVESTTPMWSRPPETPREHLEARENRNRINVVLDRLPRKFREVIALHYIEDRSYLEIADALGITQATVQSRLQTARQN